MLDLVGHVLGTKDRLRSAEGGHYDRLSKAYNCPYCTESFTLAADLNRHLTLPCHDVKAFFCTNEGCGARFSTFGGLRLHVETMSPSKEDTKNGKASMASLRSCLEDMIVGQKTLLSL